MIENTIPSDLSKMTLGPFHPALPGPFCLFLDLDGERISRATVERGFSHKGLEKTLELRIWQSLVPYVDHLDPEAAPFCELALCMAVEEIAYMSPPPRAQLIRAILCELSRLSSHLLATAKVSRAVGAETVFHYVMRDREKVVDLMELLTGSRFAPSFSRFGGVRADVTAGFIERALEAVDTLRLRLKEYNDLFSFNHTFRRRTIGVGRISPAQVIEFGLTGPNARASGGIMDVRKDFPYSGYDLVDFSVCSLPEGDVHARFLVRLKEIFTSAEILQNLCETLPPGDFNRGVVEKDFAPPAGEAFCRVESPRGLLACHVIASGGRSPVRVQFRTPSCQALDIVPELLKGGNLEDLLLVLASLDIQMAEVDR